MEITDNILRRLDAVKLSLTKVEISVSASDTDNEEARGKAVNKIALASELLTEAYFLIKDGECERNGENMLTHLVDNFSVEELRTAMNALADLDDEERLSEIDNICLDCKHRGGYCDPDIEAVECEDYLSKED